MFWQETWLRRTCMSVEELLCFGLADGRRRRDLRTFRYFGSYCSTCVSDAIAAAAAADSSATATFQDAAGAVLVSQRLTCPPPDVSVGEVRLMTSSSCSEGDECRFCHSSVEFLYHFDNYKRYPCCVAAHLVGYPSYLVGNACSRDTMGMSQPERDSWASEVQKCPFFHTRAESEAWECWRQAYSSFAPWRAGDSSTYQRQGRVLSTHEWYERFRAAHEAYRQRVVAEAERVWRGDVATLVVCEFDVLTIAELMDEACTHRALCFLAFADFTLDAVAVRWPPSHVSAQLAVEPSSALPVAALSRGFGGAGVEDMMRKGLLVHLEPLAAPLDTLPTWEHKSAVARWLLDVCSKDVKDALLNTLPFFPHCTGKPETYDVPHHYLRYLEHVAKVLRDGWTPKTSTAGLHDAFTSEGQVRYAQDPKTGRLVAAGVVGDGAERSASVASPQFLQGCGMVVLCCIAHGLVECGWIRKRHVVREVVEAFLAAEVSR